MTNEDMNIIQQVLRGITVSLALEQKADMARLGSALQAFATNSAIDSVVSTMLIDLAEGISMLGSFGAKKN